MARVCVAHAFVPADGRKTSSCLPLPAKLLPFARAIHRQRPALAPTISLLILPPPWHIKWNLYANEPEIGCSSVAVKQSASRG